MGNGSKASRTRGSWFLTVVLSAIVFAANSASPASFTNPLQKNAAIQEALIFLGYYDGLADGTMGPRSIDAIKVYQRQVGAAPTGDLEYSDLERLLRDADAIRDLVGFKIVEGARTSVPFALPTNVFIKPVSIRDGTQYSAKNASTNVVITRFPKGRSLQQEYDNTIAYFGSTPIDMKLLRANSFFVSGSDGTKDQYYTARLENGSMYGLGIVTPTGDRKAFGPLTVAMASAFHYGTNDFGFRQTAESPKVAELPQVRQPEAQVNFAVVPRAEAISMVSSLLSAAGISDFSIDAAYDPPTNGVSISMPDGSKGHFTAARGIHTPTADEMAASSIEGSASDCIGDFSSGKKSLPTVDGAVVRQVLKKCKTGEATVVTEETIVRGGDGFLHTFAILYRADDTNSHAENSTAGPGLVDAVMKFQKPR